MELFSNGDYTDMAKSRSSFCWNRDLEQRLWQMLHAKRKLWKAGCSCMYFQLNKELGVKLYRQQAQRDFAVKTQAKAFAKGLAPRFGETFKLLMPFLSARGSMSSIRRGTLHGYITEVAIVPDYFALWELEDFHDALDEAGLNTSDAYGGNVGYVDGRLVCIDFDPVSQTN